MPLLVWLTNPPRSPLLAVTLVQVGLLARVNDPGDHPSLEEDFRDLYRTSTGEVIWNTMDLFGDSITKKKDQVLRIGYQNIGGFSFTSNSIKDDIFRQGLNAFEFDIFGVSKTNVDWHLLPDQHKLYFRTKYWWETRHVSQASNITLPSVTWKQFGGVALFSIGPSVYRVVGKGVSIYIYSYKRH
jgi:hypothetical protein